MDELGSGNADNRTRASDDHDLRGWSEDTRDEPMGANPGVTLGTNIQL